AGGEQTGIDAHIEIQHPVLDPSPLFRRYDVHPAPLICWQCPWRLLKPHRAVFPECCGKPKALLHAPEIHYFVPEPRPQTNGAARILIGTANLVPDLAPVPCKHLTSPLVAATRSGRRTDNRNYCET